MLGLTTDTFPRPPSTTPSEDPSVLYVRSYLLIRTGVGVIGILLPFLLAFGDLFFVRRGIVPKGFAGPPPSTSLGHLIHLRGSISAYYHTGVGDLFVAGLCVVGFLLLTYMAGQRRTWDFALSLVAGAAVLGVVLFPTGRPAFPDGTALCGPATSPTPPSCAPVQTLLGEHATAGIHFFCAAVFILSLSALCFVFAHRMSVHEPTKKTRHIHTICGVLILVAVAWVAVGGLKNVDVFDLTPLYLGELVAVWSFGVSWLVKGESLRPLVPHGPRAHPSDH